MDILGWVFNLVKLMGNGKHGIHKCDQPSPQFYEVRFVFASRYHSLRPILFCGASRFKRILLTIILFCFAVLNVQKVKADR